MTGINFGNIFLAAGLAVSLILFVILIFLLFSYKKNEGKIKTEKVNRFLRITGWLSFIFTAAASLFLVYLFLIDVFQSIYVYNYSSSDLPVYYKLSAFWAGQSGSLLFWQLLNTGLFLYIIGYCKSFRRSDLEFKLITGLLLLLLKIYFFILLIFPARPFGFFNVTPLEGSGLNPMLQSPGMIVHPPLTFAAYAAAAVPIVFVLAGALSRKDIFTDKSLLKTFRFWTLIGWFTLTLGIIIGGQWAYYELGWGGYWDWDPVENASLLPWFFMTAMLHNIITYRRFKILKLTTALLAAGTYLLVINATFLTRSAILDSVHAFGSQDLGRYLLYFLITGLVLTSAVIFFRRRHYYSENRLENIISREGLVILTNITLVIFAVGVGFATMFPVISELALGQRVSLEQGFYNQIALLLGGLLVVFLGLCHFLNWKKGINIKKISTEKTSLTAAVITLFAGILLGRLVLNTGFLDTFFLTIIFLALTALLLYAARDIKSFSRKNAFTAEGLRKLLYSRKRRYSILIIHLGLLVLIFGLVGYSLDREYVFRINIDETIEVEDYSLGYQGIQEKTSGNNTYYQADFSLKYRGQERGVISSTRRFHPTFEQPYTIIGLERRLLEDFYLILGGWTPGESATVQIRLNPLVRFVWLGSYIIYSGALLLLIPGKIIAPKKT